MTGASEALGSSVAVGSWRQNESFACGISKWGTAEMIRVTLDDPQVKPPVCARCHSTSNSLTPPLLFGSHFHHASDINDCYGLAFFRLAGRPFALLELIRPECLSFMMNSIFSGMLLLP